MKLVALVQQCLCTLAVLLACLGCSITASKQGKRPKQPQTQIEEFLTGLELAVIGPDSAKAFAEQLADKFPREKYPLLYEAEKASDFAQILLRNHDRVKKLSLRCRKFLIDNFELFKQDSAHKEKAMSTYSRYTGAGRKNYAFWVRANLGTDSGLFEAHGQELVEANKDKYRIIDGNEIDADPSSDEQSRSSSNSDSKGDSEEEKAPSTKNLGESSIRKEDSGNISSEDQSLGGLPEDVNDSLPPHRIIFESSEEREREKKSTSNIAERSKTVEFNRPIRNHKTKNIQHRKPQKRSLDNEPVSSLSSTEIITDEFPTTPVQLKKNPILGRKKSIISADDAFLSSLARLMRLLNRSPKKSRQSRYLDMIAVEPTPERIRALKWLYS